MRLLALNQFYAPDHAATAQLLQDLCESLVEFGDEVTVITGRGGYFGGKRFPARERIAGVNVRRPWSTSLGKKSLIHRVADYGTFWGAAVVDALRVDKPDVVLALTTPPMIALGAALACGARGVPWVAWVQDVYPEVAARFGVISEKAPGYRALHLAAKATNRTADRIVALSPRMAERLEDQGADPTRLRIIPNWADGALVRSVPHSRNEFRARHGIGDRFVALYSGNLGVGHEFDTFAHAARRLEAEAPEVLFLFVGDGSRRGEAERLTEGLSNVRFLPYQPREALSESLSAADVHLISLREGLDGLLVPSKLYGALASGRSVFFVGPERCEVSRVVEEHELGWCGRPGSVESLVEALKSAAGDRRRTLEVGERARQVFSSTFDRHHAVASFRSVLLEAADRRRI
jgi:glycosyltransferase involved in cell wall biosynthesis